MIILCQYREENMYVLPVENDDFFLDGKNLAVRNKVRLNQFLKNLQNGNSRQDTVYLDRIQPRNYGLAVTISSWTFKLIAHLMATFGKT
jgi:hypothetical protein